MKKGLRFSLIIALFFSLGFVSAAAVDDSLHLNILVTNSSDDIVTGTFDFDFNISTSSDCANVIYTNSTNLTTDSRGMISYYLENVNLNFSQQYWLCYYRDGTLINASKISKVPYTFSSAWFAGANSTNSTQFAVNGGILNVLESWFSASWSNLFRNYFNQQLNTTDSPTFNNLTLTGKAGIGTASPNATLHINMSSSIPAIKLGGKMFYLGGTNEEGVSILNFFSAAGNRQMMFVDSSYFNSSGYPGIRILLGGATAMIDAITPSGLIRKNLLLNNALTINSSGYVGIGTANPSQKLEVNGTIKADNVNLTGNLTANGNYICNSTVCFTFEDLNATGSGGSGNYFNQQLNTTSSPTFVNGTFTGNVGIGTASPSSLLDIKGDAGSTGNSIVINGTGSANYASIFFGNQLSSNSWQIVYRNGTTDAGKFIIYYKNSAGAYTNYFTINNDTGNVGIGTASPKAPLEVKKAGAGALPISSGTTPNAAEIVGTASDSQKIYMGTGTASPYPAWIQVSSETDLSLNFPLLLNPNGGNVGIGTTNPLNTLNVVGTTRIDSAAVPFILNETGQSGATGYWRMVTDGGEFRLDRNTAAARDFSTYSSDFYVSTTGNVGIGTANPSQKLEVNGNVNITGNLTVGGNRICNSTACFTFEDLNATGTGGGMDYTNVAMTNKTENYFQGNQTINNSFLRIVGSFLSAASLTGYGLEFYTAGETGYLRSINRTSATYKPFNFDANPMNINAISMGDIIMSGKLYAKGVPITNYTSRTWSTTNYSIYNLSLITLPLSANSDYSFFCNFNVYASATTVGVHFNLSYPIDRRFVYCSISHPTAQVTGRWISSTNETSCIDPSVTSMATLAEAVPVQITGMINTGATSGNFELTSKAEVAGTVTILQGGYCSLTSV